MAGSKLLEGLALGRGQDMHGPDWTSKGGPMEEYVGSAADDEAAGPISLFVDAPDGLKLHVRSYGPAGGPNLPVVCLPGLTRTTADFHALGTALSTDRRRPRRVISLDYRGRGLSEYDRNPANYNVGTELGDLQAVLAALDIASAAFVGTSRGGILVMLLATVQPDAIAGAVLNDIGPVIEPAGLARIKSYVGRMRQPQNFDDAAEILRSLFGRQFPRLRPPDWLAAAHKGFKEENGRLVPTYDMRLAETLAGAETAPALWTAFEALARAPLMVIRGANSDLLSEQTMADMAARHPQMTAVTVPDQGHPPILDGADLIERIAGFVATCGTIGQR